MGGISTGVCCAFAFPLGVLGGGCPFSWALVRGFEGGGGGVTFFGEGVFLAGGFFLPRGGDGGGEESDEDEDEDLSGDGDGNLLLGDGNGDLLRGDGDGDLWGEADGDL
jgi:hypothetical protein